MVRIARIPLLAVLLVLALALTGCEREQVNDDGSAASPPPASSEDSSEEAGSDGGGAKSWDAPPKMALEDGVTYTATLKTNKGEMVVDLFADEAPNAVNNFVFLANERFYDGVVFHRIIKDFMVQTGDPEGTGGGGPGYTIEDDKTTRDYERGIVAMANTGQPNSAGSQFFIVHNDTDLPKTYSIFGQVTKGLDVLDAIANTPVEPNAQGEPSSPTETVTLEQVRITEGQ
jgi:peptidylprolyl isomerase